MRAGRLASLLAGAGMLAVTASGAQARCASPADESAFDVAALKSELSVLANQCGETVEYNRFVEQTRRELVRADAVVNAWFKRTYGRAAQARYDNYITLQANEQSFAGTHEGGEFCPRWKPVFSEAMAVPVALLPQYAAAKNLMPVDLACTSGQVATASTRGGRPAHSTAAKPKKK